jgi:hypothetical protein
MSHANVENDMCRGCGGACEKGDRDYLCRGCRPAYDLALQDAAANVRALHKDKPRRDLSEQEWLDGYHTGVKWALRAVRLT